MAIDKELSEQLKELKANQRKLKKKEKELKENLKVEKDILKWQKIMDVRSACNKLIQDAELGMRMTLTKLDKYPEYYVYQHPVHKKLKTADRNEEWVRKYIGEVEHGKQGGLSGDIQDLINTARKSTLASWKRMNARKKRRAAYLKRGTFVAGTGKGRASNTGIG